jgi:hypothetical protein
MCLLPTPKKTDGKEHISLDLTKHWQLGLQINQAHAHAQPLFLPWRDPPMYVPMDQDSGLRLPPANDSDQLRTSTSFCWWNRWHLPGQRTLRLAAIAGWKPQISSPNSRAQSEIRDDATICAGQLDTNRFPKFREQSKNYAVAASHFYDRVIFFVPTARQRSISF